MNNYEKIKKHLNNKEYARLLLFASLNFSEIAIKYGITRDSVISCFWKIRKKLQDLGYIPPTQKGKMEEEYAYKHLKELAQKITNKKKTNYERIKAMSVEEMAEWLAYYFTQYGYEKTKQFTLNNCGYYELDYFEESEEK